MTEKLAQKRFYTLSKSQNEIFRWDIKDYPGSNINTICGVGYFNVDYPDDIIEKAINIILKHQQGIRVRVCEKNGEYFIYEQKYVYEKIPVLNLGDISEDELQEMFNREADKCLFFLDAPLYKITLIRTGKKCILSVLTNHLIADGWSLWLFFGYVSKYCQELVQNKEISASFRPFLEMMEEQKKVYDSPRYEQNRLYWKQMYENWQGACRLKPDTTVENDLIGDRVEAYLDKQTANKVIQLAEELKVSPAVLFQATLVACLYLRNPDKTRIDIGHDIRNRKNVDEINTMGLFIAELMLCVPIKADYTFKDLYNATSQANISSYYNGLCLHDEILEIAQEMHPEAECIRDVEFSYQPFHEFEIKDIETDWISNSAPMSSLLATVTNIIDKDNFIIIFDYRKNVLEQEEAKELLETFIDILKLGVENPSHKIADIFRKVK